MVRRATAAATVQPCHTSWYENCEGDSLGHRTAEAERADRVDDTAAEERRDGKQTRVPWRTWTSGSVLRSRSPPDSGVRRRVVHPGSADPTGRWFTPHAATPGGERLLIASRIGHAEDRRHGSLLNR